MSDYRLPEGQVFDKIGMRLFTKPQPDLLGILPVEKNVVRVISTNQNYETLIPSDISQRE